MPWFGRGSASELSFLRLLADRLEGRSFSVVEVTGLRYHFTRFDGTAVFSHPARAASRVRKEGLRMLLGAERGTEIRPFRCGDIAARVDWIINHAGRAPAHASVEPR